MNGIARRLGVGWHVLVHARAATDECVRTDAHELVDRHEPADDGPVVDGDVSGHLDRIRDDDVVADDAIVRDVHVRHEKASRPDGRLPGGGAASIDRAILADDRTAPDFHPGFLALVLQVLGVVADDGAVADFHALTDARVALDDGVRGKRAALAYGDTRSDDAVGPDGNVGAKVGGRIDQRRAMNHRSTTMAIISASATTCPST